MGGIKLVMRCNIKKINVEMDEAEALDVYNSLVRALKAQDCDIELEEDGAQKLLELLRGNFHSSVAGVHFPKR